MAVTGWYAALRLAASSGLSKRRTASKAPTKVEFVAPPDSGLYDRLREKYYEELKVAKQIPGKADRAAAVGALTERVKSEVIPDPAASDAVHGRQSRASRATASARAGWTSGAGLTCSTQSRPKEAMFTLADTPVKFVGLLVLFLFTAIWSGVELGRRQTGRQRLSNLLHLAMSLVMLAMVAQAKLIPEGASTGIVSFNMVPFALRVNRF